MQAGKVQAQPSSYTAFTGGGVEILGTKTDLIYCPQRAPLGTRVSMTLLALGRVRWRLELDKCSEIVP